MKVWLGLFTMAGNHEHNRKASIPPITEIEYDNERWAGHRGLERSSTGNNKTTETASVSILKPNPPIKKKREIAILQSDRRMQEQKGWTGQRVILYDKNPKYITIFNL